MNTTGASSKTDRFLAELRVTPLFRQLVPMEAGIGWPIPLRRDGRAYVTLPLFGFGIGASKGQRIDVRPPFAAITLTWATGRPVKYDHFAFERPWTWETPTTSVGIFPHDAVRDLSIAGYLELRAQLLRLYDELFESLDGKGPFSAAQSERFAELLRTLLEPALEPYYRALGPKFLDRFLPEAP